MAQYQPEPRIPFLFVEILILGLEHGAKRITGLSVQDLLSDPRFICTIRIALLLVGCPAKSVRALCRPVNKSQRSFPAYFAG